MRFIALLTKSLFSEFKHKFPMIIIFTIVSIIMAILVFWLCTMFDVLFELENLLTINKYRSNDLA